MIEPARQVLRDRIARDETIEVDELFHLGQAIMGISELRPGQREALEHILDGEDVLAVMPTGSGKSLLYQLPSLVLPGLTVVVSPLIALIKDQIDKMKAWGVAVGRFDSTLTVKQKRAMEALARSPGGKLILTTPERMATPEFREFLGECSEGVGVSLFVVDEAHCVSQWGHDFRPAYLGLRKAIEELGDPPILATTATAPPHVREDICHQLAIPEAEVVTTTFDRPNLHYECIALPGDDEKLKTLVTLLKKLPKPGIVYSATVKQVEVLYEALYRHGIKVAKYHGRMTKRDRDSNQQHFMDSRDMVMIATNAFGLGVDKADIRNVLHYHVPGSLEAYAQEAGRAGRDRKPARCVLLFSPDDVAIQEYFLKGTYPTRRQVRAVYNTLKAWRQHDEAKPTAANIALTSRIGLARSKTVLSLLKDEGFVVETEDNLFLLAPDDPGEKRLNEKAKQYEARRIADRQRLDALLAYVGTPGCRNQVILSYLGEGDSPECGRCDNCLRSQEAALAASHEAGRLEDGVLQRLIDEDDGEDMHMPRTQRLVRTKVVRIDEDSSRQASTDADTGTASFDEESEYQYEDEEGFEEGDEDYVYEDVEVIEKTAAALAEEGYVPEDAEITVLARKKVAKQPRAPESAEAEVVVKKKRRRRRRRRKKSTMPSKEAFSSPVLVKPDAEKQPKARRRKSTTAAPLVEYVRGPMRINMTPVASAGPNDVARRNTKPKKKKRRSPNASGQSAPAGPNPTVPVGADGQMAPAAKKKRRRRRRKKKSANGTPASGDRPIDFFSTAPSDGRTAGLQSPKKKRRRRRRRGSGKNKSVARNDTALADGSESTS